VWASQQEELMAIEAPPGGRQERLYRIRVAFAVAAVLGSALLMWLRQSDDALLGGSLPEVVLSVVLFGFPGLLLYLALARSATTVIAGGVLVTGALMAQWWVSARDWHSTASLGPGIVGWIYLPSIVIAVALAPGLLRSVRTYWVTRSLRRCGALVALIALSVVASVVLEPFAPWLAGVALGSVVLPPTGELRAPQWLMVLIFLTAVGALVLGPFAWVAGVAVAGILVNARGSLTPPKPEVSAGTPGTPPAEGHSE
jgi:hypothetical protein